MIGALAEFQASSFGYLIVRGTRNRLVSRLRRAKNPRYALAMAIGAVYFWFIYLKPLSRSRPPNPVGIDTGNAIGLVFGTALLLVLASLTWFVDGSASNLALDKAEAAFILPAPVSRRALVGYKLLKSQLAVLTTVLVWTVLIRRGSTSVPFPMRAIGVWLFFTTASLHRTGAEIVKAAWWLRGRGALRKHWAAVGVVVLTIIGVATSIGVRHAALSAAWTLGVKEWLVALADALGSGPAKVVLWPIQATLRPMVAGTPGVWLAALPGALVVLIAHLVWVTRVDDEAVAAGVERATRRVESVRERADERKSAIRAVKPTPDKVLQTMRLASVGWPPVAIVWKNALAMRRRTRNAGSLLFILSLLPVGGGLLTAFGGGTPADGVAIFGVIFAIEVALAGPMILRNDLRSDMVNLTALKLLPLSGRTLVAAEILSAVAPLAIVEALMLGIAAVAVQFGNRSPFAAAQTGLLLLAAVPALFVLNAAFITIQNSAPVLFPAWTKLDALANGGMEAFGQLVIVLALMILLVVATLIVPAALAAAIIFLGRSHPVLSAITATLLGSIALALEVAALILVLGRTFERTEPSEVVG